MSVIPAVLAVDDEDVESETEVLDREEEERAPMKDAFYSTGLVLKYYKPTFDLNVNGANYTDR